MSDSATYPAIVHLEQFFNGCGLIDTSGSQFLAINPGAKLSAAIAWWEKATGWRPFLPALDESDVPVETTRLFDIPQASRLLELRAGLLSVSSLTIFDTVYLQDEDFFLQPANAPAEGEPFTQVRFLGRLYSRLPNAIAITGVWGRGLTLPGDGKEAILQYAASLCVPQLALGISKGTFLLRAAESEIRFGGAGQSPLSAERAMWLEMAESTARAKKRITA